MFTSFIGGMSSHKKLIAISSNTSDFNLYTNQGNPTTAEDYVVVVESGVIVSSTSVSIPAFATGSLPGGSTVHLVNRGQILGRGGTGSNGAAMPSCNPQNGTTGGTGGDALDLQLDIDLDNTNGDIFGGGGGGGGGASNWTSCAVGESGQGGSGGGGGAGLGDGGDGGVCSSCSTNNNNGADGSAGTISAGGAGGDVSGFWLGGDGGEFGLSGSAGSSHESPIACIPETNTTGGAGGTAGKAIDLNGNSITWFGGNNGDQVKGAVS